MKLAVLIDITKYMHDKYFIRSLICFIAAAGAGAGVNERMTKSVADNITKQLCFIYFYNCKERCNVYILNTCVCVDKREFV